MATEPPTPPPSSHSDSSYALRVRRPQTAETEPGGLTPDDPDSALPASIGPYRVIRLLGQGGMGQVFECEQTSPHRSIALKVIRPGLGTGSILKRFEREADLLGRLQHPGIARIIEAGTADAGRGPQPYLAMEYVRGKPLNDYCRSTGRGVRQRLELMRLVCDAVEHAHTRGIIHRDLKPANILVDDAGQPHILDFGIARLTGPEDEQNRLTIVATGERQLMGTLDYMSPEQAVGDPRLVDARSDVYALGVILFELLTGVTPHRLDDRPLPEAARVISQDDARRLVTVNTKFRGDLDTITAKALEKDRSRRYPSAAALGEDLGRYLGNVPISARPASTLYQLRKFARRNRALVAGVALAFLAITVGLIISLVKTFDASRAQAAAERSASDLRTQLTRSEQIVALLKDSFESITPEHAMGKDTSLLRRVLGQAEARLSDIRSQPQVEAELRILIGDVSMKIADYESAERNLRLALAIDEAQAGGTPNRGSLEVLTALSALEFARGQPERALLLSDQALAASPSDYHGPELVTAHLGRAASLKELARWDDALDAVNQAQRVLDSLQDPAAPDLRLSVRKTLATIYMSSERAAEAIPILREVATVRAWRKGPDHPEVADDLAELALAYHANRDAEGCERVARQALEVALRSRAEESDTVSNLRNTLGLSFTEQGRSAEAIPLFERRLEFVREHFGVDTLWEAFSLANLGTALTRSGRATEAIEPLTRAAELTARVAGEQTPQHGDMRVLLASALRDAGRVEEAYAQAARGLAAHEAAQPEGSIDRMGPLLTTSLCACDLLWSQRDTIDPAQADRLSSQAIAGVGEFAAFRATMLPEDHWAMRLIRQQVVFAQFSGLIARRRAGVEPTRADLEAIARAIEAEVQPLDDAREEIPPWLHRSILSPGPRWLACVHTLWNEVEPGSGHDAMAAEWQERMEAASVIPGVPTTPPG